MPNVQTYTCPYCSNIHADWGVHQAPECQAAHEVELAKDCTSGHLDSLPIFPHDPPRCLRGCPNV